MRTWCSRSEIREGILAGRVSLVMCGGTSYTANPMWCSFFRFFFLFTADGVFALDDLRIFFRAFHQL